MKSKAEFLAQFTGEAREYLVRILWVDEHPQLDEAANEYRGKARFVEAIDVATGELIGRHMYNWLFWLAPKKAFGRVGGFSFKRDKIYRIVVRSGDAAEGFGTPAASYLVEKVLASEVDEPRLDPVAQFDARFAPETQEELFLIKQRIAGWAVQGENRDVVATYLARVDAAGQLHEGVGRLRWMEKNQGSLNTNFDTLGIYRVRVRPSLADEDERMMVKVLGKAKDERLARIAEEYAKPVVVANALGEFTLNRNYNWFEGKIDWPGGQAEVLLDVEEGQTAAPESFAKLEAMAADAVELDRRVREFACDNLWEYLPDWCDEEVTREDFMRRIAEPSIQICSDGTGSFSFDSDNMFTDHAIMVYFDEAGELSEVTIAG